MKEELVSTCLVNLFATAGLRRLPKEKSDALLEVVCRLIRTY